MHAPVTQDLVLLGGGHSHVAVLRNLAMRPVDGARITLITRDLLTPYSGMLPGLVAGHYTHEQSHIDLQRLARFARARLYHDDVCGLDLGSNRVHCRQRPAIRFDWLSIDIGSTPRDDHIRGALQWAVPVKPIDAFLDRLAEFDARMLEHRGAFRILVIGAGAGGVELALSLNHRFKQALVSRGSSAQLALTVATRDPEPMLEHGASVRALLRRALSAAGIALITGHAVIELEADVAHLDGAPDVGFDAAVLVTHASPAAWLADTGLTLDRSGFVRVGDTLQSTSHEHVFAAGDVAAFENRPLLKSGVYAVRQGPVLAANLRRSLEGRVPRPYRPQKHTLALISTGTRDAVVSYGRISTQGAWAWRLKDWIDRRWIRRYQELPAMEEARKKGTVPFFEAQAEPMRCGGCGSKVSSAILRRALERIETPARDDVLLGLESPDDAAVIAVPAGSVLVQSVDHFRPFIDDPYLFGRITATHCLGDLYAMGAQAQSAQAMVTLAFAPEKKLEDELYQLLAGAASTLSEAGAALIGGHTGEGPEASFGLAVNGLAHRHDILKKGGMRPGDVLVLTKPLGTGVIFAADMRAQAPASSVHAALDSMQRSNHAAAQVLREHGATACTDVTGFGLLGHLVEMLNASRARVRLHVERLPALTGALPLLDRGFHSTLHPANEAFASALGGVDSQGARRSILFDPQTSGGLLASLPADRAAACLERLERAGYDHCAVIGTVLAPRAGTASVEIDSAA